MLPETGMCVSQVMKGSAASCWSTTASPNPAKMEPLVSAAWRDPGATVPKVGNPITAHWNQSLCVCRRAFAVNERSRQKYRVCVCVRYTRVHLGYISISIQEPLNSVLFLKERKTEEQAEINEKLRL